MINPLDFPIMYEHPRRIAPSGWTKHIPLGMFLVDLLKPVRLVELGTYTGVSYCAFCQAVDRLGLSTSCTAVDTWEGDPQTGFYGGEVLEDLRAHHDPLYGSFSELIQSSFDQALLAFEDGSIDLLHIDGCHTYQAVRNDWTNWLPKMSARGVLLFHDIAVRKGDFGVWKLWEELRHAYPGWGMQHAHGLGMLAVGEEIPRGFRQLVDSPDEAKERLSDHFRALGEQIVPRELTRILQGEKERDPATYEYLLDVLNQVDSDLVLITRGEERSIQALQAELTEIKSSWTWNLTRRIWGLRTRLFPPESRQDRVLLRALSIFKTGAGRSSGVPAGPRGGPSGGDQPRAAVPRPSVPQEAETKKGQAQRWVEDYHDLRRAIDSQAASRRSEGRLDPPDLISIPEEQLEDQAADMQFSVPDSPLVSIVIPVWNQARLTLECLASILQNTGDVPYELILVDDGSDDATPGLLSRIRNVKIVHNPEQRGYVTACNCGVDQAAGEYLLFLNNDVQVREGWLRALTAVFEQFPDVGAAGPKVLFPDGRLQEAGAYLNPDGTSGLAGVFEDPDRPRFNYLREVEYISGVCILVRREEFLDLGRFSERFVPAYGEDVDLCLRLRQRGKRIYYTPDAVIVHHLSASTDALGKGIKQQLALRNSQKLMENWGEFIRREGAPRLIAFYLPQYHPIPENDHWWGKGFTEWTNVAGAKPNYRGHPQPRLPADLGFYDLRVEGMLEQQAALARRYGIHGFCFYYYWFQGKRPLEHPLRGLRDHHQTGLPFCLCWANEPWTRTWDGHQDQVLIAQEHGEKDDLAFIEDVAPYLKHPDYIRVGGKPILMVYRVDLLPAVERTVETWRTFCKEEGIGELYLVLVEAFEQARSTSRVHPAWYGFDGAVEFPPHPFDSPVIYPPGEVINPLFRGTVHDYPEKALRYLRAEDPAYPRFRGVMPSWDNTPRRQNRAAIYANSSPGCFQAWLEEVLQHTREQFVGEERLVFLNAWNEWAEGAALEPDQRHGHGYLEAVRSALDRDLLKGGGS